MKSILCTTDFSRPSSKVCRYAVQLAAQTGARLTILHAWHPSWTDDDETPTTKTDVEARLKRLARRLEKWAGGGMVIETICKEALAEDAITETAAAMKPDLLVMSTIGELPDSPGVFGSITGDMIAKSPVPLLLVSPMAHFKPFENVYLAVDVNSETDEAALLRMVDSLRAFNVVLTIFPVVTDPDAQRVKETLLKIREILKDYPHVTDITQGDDFVEASLAQMKTHKADLMVVFPKQRSWVERWLKPSSTEELMLRTDLPVLAIS